MKRCHRRAFYIYFSVFLFVFCYIGFFADKGVIGKAERCFPKELALRGEFDLDSNRIYNIPIIMYHSTFEKKPGNFNIPPSQLKEDFAWIKENGYQTVTVSDLILFQERGISLPQKPIMLTFDDGYTNNYLYMFPLLKEYNLKCVLSVVGSLSDSNYLHNSENPKPSWAHMDYEQIKILSESGIVEIQNHTYDMHHCNGKRHGMKRIKGESVQAYEEKLTKDLKRLDEKLLKYCGIKTTAVAYPFGAHSDETVPILKRLGYKASFSCRAGINKITRTSSLFNLKRFNRPYGKTSSQYFEGVLNKIASI